MINGYCRTNLDNYGNFYWPTIFVDVPRMGERVLSICGQRSLKVVGVTHKVKSQTDKYMPLIEVELNK